MKKLILCLLLILAMTLSLAACDKKNKKKDTTTAAPTTTTAAPTTTTVAPGGATTPAPGGATTTTTAPSVNLEPDYQSALQLIESGSLEEAYDLLVSLGDYKDAAAYLSHFHWVWTSYRYEESASYYNTTTAIIGADGLPTLFHYEDQDEFAIQDTVTYDELGRRIQSVQSYNSQYAGYNESTYTYTYDAEGRLTQIHMESNKNSSSTTTYTYDENGNLLSVGSAANRKTEYTYDASGRVLTMTRTSPNPWGDPYVSTYAYTYGTDGKLTLTTYTNENGDVSTYTYTYNAAGLLVEELRTKADGKTDTLTYTYDAKGQLIAEDMVGASAYDSYRIEYTYDQHGNLLTEVRSSSTKTYTYQLVYIPYDFSADEVKALFGDYID